MSTGSCTVCPGGGCAGADTDPLSTLDIRTHPGGSSCTIASRAGTKGQEVVVDSTKTKHVDVIVEMSTNHSTVNVAGQSKKTISVPAGSSDNKKCFHFNCSATSTPNQVGLTIELELDRGQGRPNTQLTTLNVKRRP